MASDRVVAESLGRIYTAAGRGLAPQDCDVYLRELGGVTDDELERVAERLVTEDWAGRRPTPGLVLTHVHRLRALARPPGGQQDPVTPREQLKARIADVRASRLRTEETA